MPTKLLLASLPTHAEALPISPCGNMPRASSLLNDVPAAICWVHPCQTALPRPTLSLGSCLSFVTTFDVQVVIHRRASFRTRQCSPCEGAIRPRSSAKGTIRLARGQHANFFQRAPHGLEHSPNKSGQQKACKASCAPHWWQSCGCDSFLPQSQRGPPSSR